MQPGTATPKGYMPGFGNDFETEALPGALPVGRNSPPAVRLWPVRRTALRVTLYGTAYDPRAKLVVPHPPICTACIAVYAH